MTILSAIWSLVDKIPATFWSVVAGSGFTLLGVWLSNRASNARLVTQFDHEASERKKDREMDLRRNLYLDAVDAYSSGLAVLERLPNLTVPHDKVDNDFAQKAAAIDKAFIIAGPEMLTAMQKTVTCMDAAVIPLFAKRIRLMSLKNKIEFCQNTISKMLAEQSGRLDVMRHYDLEGQRDPNKWRLLEMEYKATQKHLEEQLKHQKEFEALLEKEHSIFRRECVANRMLVATAVDEIFIAARRELNLPVDAAAYRHHASEPREFTKKKLEDYWAQIEATSEK